MTPQAPGHPPQGPDGPYEAQGPVYQGPNPRPQQPYQSQPGPQGPYSQHPGATTFAPPPKKRRVWLWVLIGVLALFLITIVACSAAVVGVTKNAGTVPIATRSAKASPEASDEPSSEPSDDPTEEPSQAPTKEPTKEPTKKALTAEQENAIGAAEDYLDYSAFSRKGLIQQLSSDAGDGYSKKDATFAVDSLDTDYNKQAAKAAKSYLEYSHFSHKGLVEQLESDAGDGYTHDQAEYGASHAR